MAARPLIAGNWKMFGHRADLGEIEALREGIRGLAGLDVAVCLPATLIGAAAGLGVPVGGQDCARGVADGPHTGDVSAAMLADAGARYCIVGHSERRRDHGETDAHVRAKAAAAQQAGLTPILCVGESLEEREAGRAEDVVARQLEGSLPDGSALVIAYEPVWAIGTGRVPVPADIEAMHGRIRRELTGRSAGWASAPILYGGSVKPANAQEIFATPGVDGALVGAASLKAADFLAIIAGHPAAKRP